MYWEHSFQLHIHACLVFIFDYGAVKFDLKTYRNHRKILSYSLVIDHDGQIEFGATLFDMYGVEF